MAAPVLETAWIPETPPTLAAARAYCSRLARSRQENFTVVSLLLPRRLVPHFHAVYSWCRVADDLADECGTAASPYLQQWRTELDACFAGQPRHPITVALAQTIRTFNLPRQPFLDLLEAFEQDQRVTRYRTFSDLLDYCRRSANPVGRIVLALMESATDENHRLSDLICTGLQLANFWQDLGPDLDQGRVYLPEEDRRLFGYSDADFLSRRSSPSFRELMRFQVDRTRAFFLQGEPLIDRVPREFKLDIHLFVLGGSAILDRLARQGFDAWQRPRLTTWNRFTVLARALTRRVVRR